MDEGYKTLINVMQNQITKFDEKFDQISKNFDVKMDSSLSRIYDKIDEKMDKINKKIDDIMVTNYTKKDMEEFVDNVCKPARVSCQETGNEIKKLNNLKLKLIGAFLAINGVWGVFVTVLVVFKDQITKILVN